MERTPTNGDIIIDEVAPGISSCQSAANNTFLPLSTHLIHPQETGEAEAISHTGVSGII